MVKKVTMHTKLQHDRRLGSVRTKEKEMLALLNKPQRNQKDEYIKGSSIVSDQSFVDACAIVMRFCEILKDKSANIIDSRGYSLFSASNTSSDHTKVQEIVPYMVSVLWAGKHLNIPVFQEFYHMMSSYYGPGVAECVEK